MRVFNKLKQVWDRRGFEILVISIIIFFILYWWLDTRFEPNGTYSKSYYYHPELAKILKTPPPSYQKFSSPSSPKNMECSSKGEKICKMFMEQKFQRPFNKCRPSFLHNPVTGENLELDMYNNELRIAVEYNGRQHYEFVPFFHQSREKFQTQKYRDLMKKDLCAKHGIILITVPYTIKEQDIPQFLENALLNTANNEDHHNKENKTYNNVSNVEFRRRW